MTELRTNRDVVAQIRQRKDELGLADEYFEDKVGMSAGNFHKYFGAAPTKTPSSHLLLIAASFLGLKVLCEVDPDYNPSTVNEWQRRDERKLHPSKRKTVSARILGRAGGLKRAANLTLSRRKEIAQKAGKASGRSRRKRARVKSTKSPSSPA